MANTKRDSAQALFIDVMDRLRAQYDPYEPINGIIAETCRFFGFGCGFIYETDHTGLFLLREQYCNYSNDALQINLRLEDYLRPEQMAELSHSSIVFFPTRSGISQTDARLAELFDANSLLLVTIDGTDNHPIGIVGMSDRRGRILLSAEEINVARSILSVVANHVKLRLYQKKVETSQKALESMVDNMGIDVYVNDFETHEILYVNKSMAAPYGGKEKLIGKACWQSLYEDKTGQCDYCPQHKLIDENCKPTRHYSWDYQRPFDGSWFRVFSAAFHWTDGRLAHVVSSVDITENKNYEETIRQMAEYDTLTGLPNRRKLLDDLTAQLGRSSSGYVLFFDLDHFKIVNDTLGHRADDELLAGLGTMLQKHRLTTEKSYRHSGDEFVILLEGASAGELQEVVDLLLGTFKAPWKLRDGDAHCGTSIGVAAYPKDGSDAEELIHKADMAMYMSKRGGRNAVRHYDEKDF